MKPGRKDIEDIIALTPMQEGMLFHYLEDPGSDYYFEQLNLDISGEIEIDIFEKAWNFVIETNEMLRTLFRWQEVENPLQIILKKHHIQPAYYDFSGKTHGEKQKRPEEVMLNDREKKFELQQVPSRINLCKLETGKYRMIVSNHHILYDGWSNGIILKEFFKAYDDLSKGRGLEKPVKTRFKEFIQWVQNQDIEKQEKYWRSYLEGFDTCTQLPVKRKKSAQGNKNKTYRWKWRKGKSDELTDFLKDHKLTFASLLYSAWGVLLQRYNNIDDVVFGTTVSGRSAKLDGIEDMVGLFINTIPLRTWGRPHEKAGDLLKRTERELHLRQEYEHSSLVNIRKWSEISKGQKLFDSIVILENYPLENRLITGNSGLSIDTSSIFELTHYDLTISVSTFAEIEVKVIYPGDLFNDESIEKLIHCFASIVETLKENPGQLTAGIEIISKEEKNKILYDFNDTRAEYPAHKTIHQLFAEQVERAPDHTALLGPEHDARQRNNRSHWSNMSYISITYRHLNQKSHQLAYLLKEKGVAADTIVGLMVERSIEMIIGIFGILKAGGAYLPIDPGYPRERIDYMLNDSGAKIFITRQDISSLFSPQALLNLSEGRSFNSHHSSFIETSHHSENLAYVIYTSGTTGKPKGVVIEHRSLVNRLNWVQKKYPIDNSDTILQKTTFTFDVSVWEILWWSIAGAKLCLLIPGGENDPESITQTVQRNNVTAIHFVPSMLSVFLDYLKASGNVKKLSCLKQVISSGEALLPGHVEQFNQLLNKENNTKLANLYGPTEATIEVSFFNCPPGELPGDIVPIGKPIDNIHLYVLNNYLKLQPIGVPGELFISGTGLARGYINRPELTAQFFRFYRSYMSYPSYILYKTGDLALWLSDGNIEFLGRKDHQVKIRGFRIELGEIESRLTGHEDIKEAVVVSRPDSQKENQVHAFIVSEKNFSTAELRTYLVGQLPAYMIPAYFKQIERIPLTSSGKVDRKALISTQAAQGLETGAAYVPPGSDIEKTIAQIWKELLGLEKLSVHDNFFDIGGNSLTIIRLNSRLKKAFKKDIPMAAMFTYPTISAMAAHLSGKDKEEPKMVRETGKKGLDIAVIGMSCQFPGAKNIHEFWDNVKNGIESIVFFANEELIDLGAEAEVMNDRHYVPAKGILKDKEYFDASFFDYTPAEAEIMDPQMRLFHECCWEGLEDAGYDPGTYDGLIGLYAGASSNPLWEILPLSSDSDYSEQWGAFQLSDKDYTGTRVGYKLGLKGPCITLQTACSTSLAAVDLACQGLLNRVCDMALAGGVSITMHDETGYNYREGSIMSRDGHCRPFDTRANGTLGGNGAGVVVLKPLENAIKDRDNIYAVIKSSALNNDGKNKVGFTAPGVEGQANVIRAAIQKAGVEPGSIGYIEAHGTGTVLGDPIEIEGLKQAFKSLQMASSYRENTCALGSVKSNIGHLDAAAGIAGLIKTVMALKHGLIPPSLHYETLNPDIDLNYTPFYINTRIAAWKNDEYPRRAGVSSFGIGGTNAHVVLEQAPVIGEKRKEREYQLILLSAKTENALEKMTRNLADYFKRNPNINCADAAYTLQVGRKPFKYRKMLVCSGIDEAAAALSSSNPGKVRSFVTGADTRPVIFMFSGQGSQYVNMGRELYEKEPYFRREIDRCVEILNGLLDYDIKEILYPFYTSDGSDTFNRSNRSYRSYNTYKSHINQTELAQPLLFVFEYALAKLLMNWGIKPAAMIGHSIGEYTAACLSGVFSLEDAIKLVALRGRLMQRIPAGAMLSVSLGEEELGQLIKNKEISLAAVNGRSRCVVSGTCQAIDAFKKELESKGCDTRRLHTSHAFHSAMMDPVLKEFEKAIHDRQVPLNKPGIPFISNVTGTWITDDQAADPGYWALHLRETVRFARGLEELGVASSQKFAENAVFVEIGPGQALSTLARQYPHKSETTGHQPLAINLVRHPRENISDLFYLLEKIGHLWLYGVNIHWAAFYRGEERYRISLPTYHFERKRFPVNTDSLLYPTGIPARQKSLKTHRNASVSDWFYTPVWEQSLPAAYKQPASHDRENWLVFIDEHGFGEALIRRLQEMKNQAAEVITVRIGSAYAEVGHGEFMIDPKQSDDYDRLFRQLKKMQNIPGKIVHLWAINEDIRKEALKNFDCCLERGFFSILEIVQAVGRQHVTDKIRIEVITNGMHEVTGEEFLQPAAATITAAIKVIPLEYNNISCRSIDIVKPEQGSVKESELLHRLLQEFTLPAEYPGNIAAFRGNHRWVQTMKPIRLEKQATIPKRLKQGGVYLVTGGLGGIGMTLAEHLAKSIKPKLILLGRTPFPGKGQWDRWLSTHEKEDDISLKINTLRRLEAHGAEIMATAADITDARDIDRVISRALEKFKTIDGILHAAGVADTNGIIQGRTGEMTESVLAPKVKGTLVLDRLLKLNKIEPDFIVLFSSLANAAPEINFGQVGYNAANEFLDAYACYKTSAEGIFTVSINWPAWEEKGMWAKASAQWDKKNKNMDNRAYQAIFENTLSPLQGIDVFCRILDSPPLPLKRAAVSPVDLTVFARQCRALRTAAKQDTGNRARGRRQKHPRPELTTPYAAPVNKTQQALTGLFEEFFGIEKIGIRDNFFELGGDSLKAVNLSSKIHKKLQIDIPLVEFFNKPFIETLAQYIMDKAEISPYSSIEPLEKKEYYELSSAQKRLFVLQRMIPGNTAYNTPFIFMLEGNLKKERLERVIGALIQRFESFRTCFQVIDGQPVQRIHDHVEFEMEYNDLATEDTESTEKRKEAFVRSFDLSRSPLLRISLIKIETQKHALMLDMHHIISDGASMNVLAKDFMAIYNGEKLPGLRIQYKDFSVWRNSEKVKDSMRRQEAYWLKEFEGEIAILNLPVDYTRPSIQSYEGNRLSFELNHRDIRAMKDYVSKEGVTLFMVLLAAYNILLSKLANQEEIIVGTPVEGRGHTGLEPIVGMFVNTLALRNYPSGNKTFKAFLKEIKKKTLRDFENREYPFEDLVEKVSLVRDMGRNPLFDAVFALQKLEKPGIETHGLKLKPYDYESNVSKFDITLYVLEIGEKLYFTFEYCTKLFKEGTIKRFIRYFRKTVSTILDKPGIKLSGIEIIYGEEKQQILSGFNETSREFPQNKTIHQLFEEQVEKSPDTIALVSVQGEELFLSYSELNEKSNQLAYYLTMKRVGQNEPVGMMVERSVEMVTGILGILKAGGGYVPLNPKAPAVRNTYILEECNIKLLLTSRGESGGTLTGASRTFLPKWERVIIQPEGLSTGGFDYTGTQPAGRPDSLAYIIFTSGSTGLPKGVPIDHANLSPLLHWGYRHFDIVPGDRTLQNLAYYFDWSVWEIFITLTMGASLYIAADEVLLNPGACVEFINFHVITVLHMTPTQYGYIVNTGLKTGTLRYLFIGAEKLKYDLVKRSFEKISPRCRLFNMYGPTEATIISAVLEIEPTRYKQFKHSSSIPIGKPAGNTGLLILDRHLKMCPFNIGGELHIAGDGLAGGYLNDPEKISKSLIQNIYKKDGVRGERLYKTGDIASWRSDGNVEYLGRIDRQVKIRGFRIEPGEIENQLLSHGGIKEAVVLVREDKTGEKYLCAYIVPANNAPGDVLGPQALREHLSGKLPGYMIPSYIVTVEALPLTPNGKIDMKALPEPALVTEAGHYTAPRDEIERKLVEIWSDVLAVEKEKISIEANFFELGGHSLKAVVMETKIHKELGIKPGLAQIFKNPFIKGLAAHIKKCAPEKYIDIEAVEERDFYELSYRQKRLWFIREYDPDSPAYNLTGRIILQHPVDGEHIKKALQRLIKRHESLRTLFTTVDDIPVQVVKKQAAAVVKISDLSSLPGQGREQKLEEIYAREALTPFNLEEIPLFRALLVKLAETRYYLIFNMHHIISDGWSIEMLKKEFTLIYESYRTGEERDPKPLKIRYKDFTRWHNKRIVGREIKEKSHVYWKERVKNGIPLLQMPFDFDKKGNERKGAAYTLLLNEEQTHKLGEAARKGNTSLFVMMFSLYILFLHRFSPGEEIACFIISAGRNHESLYPLMGYFVNMVLFKTRVDNQETFNNFLERVNREILDSFQHQEYPLELVFKELNMKHPEVPLSFNMLNIGETGQWDNPGPGIRVPFEAKFDLEPYITGYTNAIEIRWAYKKELFKAATIEYMAAQYVKLLDFFVNDLYKNYNDYINKKHEKKQTFIR